MHDGSVTGLFRSSQETEASNDTLERTSALKATIRPRRAINTIRGYRSIQSSVGPRIAAQAGGHKWFEYRAKVFRLADCDVSAIAVYPA